MRMDPWVRAIGAFFCQKQTQKLTLQNKGFYDKIDLDRMQWCPPLAAYENLQKCF